MSGVTSVNRVFVVDDDGAVRDSLKTLLEGEGFDVSAFKNWLLRAWCYEHPLLRNSMKVEKKGAEESTSGGHGFFPSREHVHGQDHIPGKTFLSLASPSASLTEECYRHRQRPQGGSREPAVKARAPSPRVRRKYESPKEPPDDEHRDTRIGANLRLWQAMCGDGPDDR